MEISRFRPHQTPAILQLFQETVHRVNCADYSPRQLAAWAPARLNRAIWARRLAGNFTQVALAHGTIIGFAELTPKFVVHTLFVHPAHQRCGVGAALLGALEAQAVRRGARMLTANVSLTAQPLFEACGFRVLRRQVVVLRGQGLVNLAMVKHLA